MVMIANYQYGWTFFVPIIQKKFGWNRASIQWALRLFVAVPKPGWCRSKAWFVDKYGPRLVVLIGGILCGIGWAINAEATSLNGYYLGMIVAGIGAGGVYGTCVGNALKWFPDKRGLAAGITAAGFGAGSALTVAPIQAMIKDSGFQSTFLYFGLGQGIIYCDPRLLSVRTEDGTGSCGGPECQRDPEPPQLSADRGDPPSDLLADVFHVRDRRRRGLMVTANLKPIAVDWKVDNVPVTLMAMDDDGGDVRRDARSYSQRPDPPVLRLVSDQIGARTRCSSLSASKDRHLDALYARPRSGLVRDPLRVGVLRLG